MIGRTIQKIFFFHKSYAKFTEWLGLHILFKFEKYREILMVLLQILQCLIYQWHSDHCLVKYQIQVWDLILYSIKSERNLQILYFSLNVFHNIY